MSQIDPINEVLTRGVEEVIVRKELEALLRSGKKIKLYLGIDPTGARLHIGHAIPLRKLRDFQRLGHHVIFLVGSFTALIGDTSDKDSPRVAMTQEQVEENFRTYKRQASKILDFSKIEIRYNGDWLSKLGFKDILELANKFTVQQMIERDMYQKRIAEGKPIGLHEFLYPLMQGYDSVAMDVDLEVGGNDQLFNMLAGRHLQRVMRNRNKYVMTMKLIEGTDGRKMSKTYNNVVNLEDEPTDMYGKLMSIKDELIIPYLLYCTDMPTDTVFEIEAAMKAGDNPKNFKMQLAREIVTLYHDAKAANEAQHYFVTTVQRKKLPADIPEKVFSKTKNCYLFELLVEIGFAQSKSEARTLIEGGGVYIDGQRVQDKKAMIKIDKSPKIIQVGNRRFIKISC